MATYIQPAVQEVSQIGDIASLRADSEQQQQQQQQQQGSVNTRRFLDAATNLPVEEITQKLTHQISTTNKLAKASS